MAPRAAVAESFTHHRGTDTFSVTFTEAFMVEVQHGAPVSLDVVSRLLSKSATLELYCALVLRAFRDERWPMPLFERGGMRDLIDLADADYKVRQDIGERLRLIASFWPELPYRLKGSVLTCAADPRAALAAHIDRAAGRDPRARQGKPAPTRAARANPAARSEADVDPRPKSPQSETAASPTANPATTAELANSDGRAVDPPGGTASAPSDAARSAGSNAPASEPEHPGDAAETEHAAPAQSPASPASPPPDVAALDPFTAALYQSFGLKPGASPAMEKAVARVMAYQVSQDLLAALALQLCSPAPQQAGASKPPASPPGATATDTTAATPEASPSDATSTDVATTDTTRVAGSPDDDSDPDGS